MDNAHKQCAREILETVPVMMRFIRDQVRQRRSAGVSLPQYRTLAFLDRVQNASLSAAAEHLGLSLPATSRLMNGLVVRKLVAREIVSTNRRQIALTLTPRGEAILEKIRGEIRLCLADVLKSLSRGEQKAVHRALQIFCGIFDRNAAVGKYWERG